MFRKLLALGAAGVATVLATIPASAWLGGFGCRCGCGVGCGFGGFGCGLASVLPGWWGPVAAFGWPMGLFGSGCCW